MALLTLKANLAMDQGTGISKGGSSQPKPVYTSKAILSMCLCGSPFLKPGRNIALLT